MSETLSALILKSAEIHEGSFTGDVQQKDLTESISQAAASIGVDANSPLVEYADLLLMHSDVQQKDLTESISQAAASIGVDANSPLVEYAYLLLMHSWNQALEIAYKSV